MNLCYKLRYVVSHEIVVREIVIWSGEKDRVFEKCKSCEIPEGSMKLSVFCFIYWQILLVENKEESVRRAAERVQSLGLSNVTLYQVITILNWAMLFTSQFIMSPFLTYPYSLGKIW